MADQAARYESPPETIALARQTMRDVKEALTTDADGEFPAKYAGIDWDGMNMRPPATSWQDMDMEQRYELLLHVLNESVWSLEPSAKWNQPSDSERLANEFITDEERQLHAEMRHDSGLRFLEGRQVRYEDLAERPLDAAGEGERQENQRDVSPADLIERSEPEAQHQQQQSHSITM